MDGARQPTNILLQRWRGAKRQAAQKERDSFIIPFHFYFTLPTLQCCSLHEIPGLVSHLLPETDSPASLLQCDARKAWRVASFALQWGTRQASRRRNWISPNGLLGQWISIQSVERVELVLLPLLK